MKKPIDLEAVRQAVENLKQIAKNHPRLVDFNNCQWDEDDVMHIIADKDIFTLEEVSTMLRVGKEGLRRSIRTGKLKAAKIGREFRIAKADLLAYWKQQGGGELFEQ